MAGVTSGRGNKWQGLQVAGVMRSGRGNEKARGDEWQGNRVAEESSGRGYKWHGLRVAVV